MVKNNFLKFVLLPILLVLCLSFPLYSQTVSGYVSDASSGERLINATIRDLSTNSGTITNNYGFFSYTPNQKKSKELHIEVSYVSYIVDTLHFTNFKKDTLLNIFLKGGLTLPAIEIKAQSSISNVQNKVGSHSLTSKSIKLLPSIGGETDLIKAYQYMPGVQQGNEGSSNLYVRGGAPDQNLIMLDDVPIYYINHLGGFVSVFNIDAVKNSNLIKGGFPAKYGGRLSSALDVSMDDGNIYKTSGNISIGLLSSKISLNGPIEKGKSAYLISFRRFYFDLLFKPIIKSLDKNAFGGYNFYDINFKINKHINNKNRLFISFYNGDDKIKHGFSKKEDDEDKRFLEKVKWGNLMAAFRWNHIFNNRMFSNTTLYYTRYRIIKSINSSEKSEHELRKTENSLLSGVEDIGLKSEIEMYMSDNMKISSGIQLVSHFFNPNSSYVYIYNSTLNINKRDTNKVKLNAFETAIYGNINYKFSNKFVVDANLRLDNYIVNSKSFLNIEPRVKAILNFTKNFKIYLAYDVMSQNMHIAGNQSTGIPMEYWLPATTMLQPARMSQYSAGLQLDFGKIYTFNSEIYLKQFSKLSILKDGMSLLNSKKKWENLFATNGTGIAKGIEFMLSKNSGRLNGWVSYTLARSYKSVSEINAGKIFPDRYDIRHSVSVAFVYKIDKELDFSCAWVYNSPAALTLPISKYTVPGEFDGDNDTEIFIYSEKNSIRVKPFHRLDVNFNFYKKRKRYERVLSIGIINLYNNNNPYLYEIGEKDYSISNINPDGDIEITHKTKIVIFQKSIFPFMPTLSYAIKF